MAGVRGFNDPNVQVNADGLDVYHQYVLLAHCKTFETDLPIGLLTPQCLRRQRPCYLGTWATKVDPRSMPCSA